MSFLNNIANYVSKTVDRVKNAATEIVAPSKSTTTIPINGNKEITIGDTYEKNTQKTQNNNPKENLGAVKQSIELACTRNGINIQELYKILMSMIGLKNVNEFNKLPAEQQIIYLGFVGAAIERAEKHCAKANKDIDITQVVVVDIKLALNALEDKVFENSKEQKSILNNKKVTNTKDNLLSKINKLKPEEIDDAIDNLESNLREIRAQKEAEIQKLPESQRAIARKAAIAEIKYIRNQIYNEILMEANSEQAIEAMTIVDSGSLLDAEKNFYRTRRSDAERMRAAEMFNYDKHEHFLKRYYDKGDALTADIYTGFTATNVSYMSVEAADIFSNDYFNARQKYDSEGYPEYMQPEMLVATAVGIASGLQINEFMSVEERANALSNFYEREENTFGDSNLIRNNAEEYVTKYVEENSEQRPNLKEEIKKIKSIIENNENDTKSQNPKTPTDNTKNNSQNTAPNNRNSSDRNSTTKEYTKVVKPTEKTTKNTNPLETSTENEIKLALSNGTISVEDAVSKCGNETVYKIIFANNSLLDIYKNKAIQYIINEKDANKLVDLANSSKARKYIISYNRGVNNKEKLYNELEKKASSFEKYMFEENRSNEVC